MRSRLFSLIAFFVMLAGLMTGAAGPVGAQIDEFEREIPLLRLWAYYNPEYKLPLTWEEAEEAVLEYKGPVEPVVPKVQFYEYDSPQHIQGRIESLVHGIKITLPPEYDHYGYEIRRFMRSVGRMEIYNNRYAIEDELVNIEKAWVVFRYWREALIAEMEALDAAIKADATTSSKIKTIFKVNEAIVKAFIIEMQAWLNTNQEFLEFLADNRREYTFERGRFAFRSTPAARRFMALFGARERAKRQIREYDPFGTVVY